MAYRRTYRSGARRSYSRSRTRTRRTAGTSRRRGRVTRRRSYSKPQEVRIVLETTAASGVSRNPFAPVIEAKKSSKAKL